MSTPRRRFLFTMWEGGGTLPPELSVARRMGERGHHVHIVGDPTIEDQATAIGAGFSPWRQAPHRSTLDPHDDVMRDWEASNPLAMLRNARDRFIAGPAAEFASDTLEVIDAVQPDVVVVDSLMFGAIVGAQAAGLPVAALVPNIWMIPTSGVPAVGPGFAPAKTILGRSRDAVMRGVANRVFAGGLPALNAARTDNGLSPLTSFWDQVLDIERILVLSSAAFDFASDAVPANVTYTGPVLDEPQWVDPWVSPWPESNDDPLILVGFSTTFQDQGDLLRRVVAALATLPVRAVVTLGQMLDPSEFASTDNVAVVPSAPHNVILEQAALAITHCGHGTTLKTLAAGVPMVCMPMGRDQNDTAARVVHHGAGVRLSPKASAAKIGAAVRQVLDGDAYKLGAERLAAAIARETESTDVVAVLEDVASHRSKFSP